MENLKDKHLTNTSTAGGAAMAGGQRFQAQVTAWWAARVLLQTPIGHWSDLPALSTPERIYAETTDSIDDIRIEFTDHGFLYGQCKRSFNLSASLQSEWGAVLLQFYKELERVTPREWQRRFVLFYETHNSNLERLNAVVNRYRLLPMGTPIGDAATNKTEQTLIHNLNLLLDSLKANLELQNLSERKEELLRHIYIKQLRLKAGEPDNLGIVDALQDGILTIPAQVIQTETSLHRLADDLLAERGSIDRLALRQRLQGEGIVLRDSVYYRSDFEKLDTWSTTEIATHRAEKRAKLVVGGSEITIVRPVVEEMVTAAQKSSFLVVGGAGSGKTGCLLNLASQLQASNFRVWYWAADSLPYHSPQEIGTHLQLQHPWAGVLAEAASGEGAILIIDGLDGLRDTRAQRAYLKLLALAIRSGITVIVSIRSFDLLHSVELKELFSSIQGSFSGSFTDSALRNSNHIIVSELSKGELNQAITQLPRVQAVLDNAPKLQSVVLNLFSLDLLCKLIASGDSAIQLSEISTQAELFERYWAKRVVSHSLHNEMEQALRQLVEKMVNEQNLQTIPDFWPGQVRDALFSAEIVRHPPTIPGRLPKQELVEFNHHLLFDYAAELLFIRSRRYDLATELTPRNNWGLFLRPSLILFFRYVWRHGRLDFWDTLIELEKRSVPLLHKMLGHLVVAEEGYTREDLEPPLKGRLGNNNCTTNWVPIIQGIVVAATFSSLPKLFNRGAGEWWIEYARELIQTDEPPLVYAGQRILFSAIDSLEALSSQSKRLLNEGAILLVKFHQNAAPFPTNRIKPALSWVCRTIDADISASSEIIRSLITKEELKRAGYIQAHELANHINDIWRADSSLAVEVYDAIFGYVEADRTSTPIGDSQILPMRSNRSQDYGISYYLLGEKFREFLSENPLEAIRALIRIMPYRQDKYYLEEEPRPDAIFTWNGCECHIVSDFNHGWRLGQYSEKPDEMLQAWKQYLIALPEREAADTEWEAIANILCSENKSALIWATLLEATRQSPAFYVDKLWSILLNPTILTGYTIKNEAESCIEIFAPYLSDIAISQIELVILSLVQDHFPHSSPETIERQLKYTTARLLSCVPEERRSAASKEFFGKCEPEMLQPRRPRSGSTFGFSSDTEIDWLVEEGVDIKNPMHQELLQVTSGLNTLSTNEIDDNNIIDILENIKIAEQRLANSQGIIDEPVNLTIQERLIQVLSKVACSKAKLDEDFKNELFERFQNLLEELPAERPADERLEAFDHHPSWGMPNRRYSAAEGFICLAERKKSFEHKEMLIRLANDPDPVIRYFLGKRIWSFLKIWPEFVWETLEHWVSNIPTMLGSIGVLRGTLYNGWFWWLRNEDTDRADQFLKNLLVAARSRSVTELRSTCGSWFAGLWFFKGESWAQETIENFLTSLKENLDELDGVQNIAINLLLPRSPKDTSKEEKERAQKFLVALLTTASQVLEASKEEIEQLCVSEAQEDASLWVRKIFGLFNHTAIEFQFSAGGCVKQWALDASDTTAQQVEWWNTTEPILEAILTLPHPSVAYHAIEGIEQLIPFDGKRGLYWLRKISLASVPQGLNVESLAADTTIKILEEVLAEHKLSLASGDEMRQDFVQTLEAYLQIGWPKAMKLAIQLESIFR